MTDYRIVRFHALGGPEVLGLETAPIPSPGPGEVLIRVKTIGVTQGDAMFRRGTYLEQPRFPSGLGTEICGVVESVGSGVTRFASGDRVSSISSFSINRYPIYGEWAVLPQTSLLATPAELTDEEGAAFTLAYAPMYLALVREARMQVGDRVLLTAAGATTALAACQIARLAGARPVGIVRTEAKARALADAGYEDVLVWDEGIVERAVAATGGGADIILDPVAGPGSEKLAEMCRRRGRIVHYGALDGPITRHSIYPMVTKSLTVSAFTIYGYSGSSVNNIPRDDVAMAQAEAFIAFGVSQGVLRPKIARTYTLDQVVDAHRALEAGEHIGKLVITV